MFARGSRWRLEKPGDYYIAVFNLGDEATAVSIPWNKLFHTAGTAEVRDLRTKHALGRKAGIETELRPHASALYRISLRE